MSDYPAIYQGRVISTMDPLQKGRVELQVPAVYGTSKSNWAIPAFAGNYAPKAGSQVWVFFVDGDIQHPVWFGSVANAGTGS